jgi:hypothetical protein
MISAVSEVLASVDPVLLASMVLASVVLASVE